MSLHRIKLDYRMLMMEIFNIFVNQYHYKVVDVKKVNGIFLENRSNEYVIVRIVDTIFDNMDEFKADLEIVKRVRDQYQRMYNFDKINVLNIFFGGVFEEEVDGIHSISIETNDLLQNNEIITYNFPYLQRLNIEKEDESNTLSGMFQNQETGRQTKVVDLRELNKSIRFTRTFMLLFVLANFIFNIYLGSIPNFIFTTGYYSLLVHELGQWYRPISALFLNYNLFYSLFFVYFFLRFNTIIELKLGTRKTFILWASSIVIVLLAMFFLVRGELISGSFPLVAILFGAICALFSLPSERDNLKANLLNTGMFLVMGIVLTTFAFNNLVLGLIGLLAGFISVIALDIKDKPIHKVYLSSLLLVVIAIIGFSLIPQHTIARDAQFEREYVDHLRTSNHPNAANIEQRITQFYQNLGVNFND